MPISSISGSIPEKSFDTLSALKTPVKTFSSNDLLTLKNHRNRMVSASPTTVQIEKTIRSHHETFIGGLKKNEPPTLCHRTMTGGSPEGKSRKSYSSDEESENLIKKEPSIKNKESSCCDKIWCAANRYFEYVGRDGLGNDGIGLNFYAIHVR